MREYFEITGFLFLIIAARYFLVAGIAYHWVWKSKRTTLADKKIQTRFPRPAIVRREIFWSLWSSLVFATAGTGGILLWQNDLTQIELDATRFMLNWGWVGFPLSFLALMGLHDTYFYWMHRLIHRPQFFRWIHQVHHDSITPTPWAAFSFHPIEAVLEAIILPLLIVVVPTHVYVIGVFLLTMTVLGVINHLGYELYPQNWKDHAIAGWVISATHHDLHHQRFRGNFGLYFTFWDRLCGTTLPLEPRRQSSLPEAEAPVPFQSRPNSPGEQWPWLRQNESP